MRLIQTIRIHLWMVAMISLANAEDKILLHEGPSTTVPFDASSRAIKVDRRFFIERQKLEKLHSDFLDQRLNPIDAIAAIHAAKSSVFKGDNRWPVDVNKLEKLKAIFPADFVLEYYLIAISNSGSEEYRIVLLDGTVLKPESQSAAVEMKNAQPHGSGQPAIRPESKSEGGDKPQPEAEGRSR